MLGTGSLNGGLINAVALNGGNFVLTAAGASNTEAPAAVVTLRRCVGASATSISVAGDLAPRLRRPLAASSSIAAPAMASFRRRILGQGAADIGIPSDANGRRRLVGQGATTIAVLAEARARFRFLALAPLERSFAVGAERRLFIVPQRAPDALVAPDVRPSIVPPEPGVSDA